MKLISVVIPARNEEETINKVLSDCKKYLKNDKNHSYEIIVVDDGSTDKTNQIAKKVNGVKVIKNTGVHGKGSALVKGFSSAKGDIIVMLDADYSHKIEDVKKLVEPLIKNKNCGMVIGSRMLGGSDEYNIVRGFGNYFLTGCFRLFFWIKLTDALNGFKAFKKDIFLENKYKSKTFEIEVELISNALKMGYKISEIPSHERKRAGGEMKSFALIHGPKFLMKIIEESIRYRFKKISDKVKK